MSENSNVNFFLPLNSEFLKDLRNHERIPFIFYLPSFLEDLGAFQVELHRVMKRYNKPLTVKNFPFFLKNGINIHYLTTIFLIDKYRYDLDSILTNINSSDRLTKKGREVMKDMLDAYRCDFAGFHRRPSGQPLQSVE